MSSASIGGTGSNLYQFLRSISGNQTTQQTGATAAVSGTASDPDGDGDGGGVQAAGGHRGHHGHGGGAMFKKIEAAVTSALQSAQSDGSSTDDPNQTVEDAISQVLNGTSSSTDATDPSTQQSTSTTNADGTTSSNDAASRQAFFDTLKQYGIDPQQFRQDLMSAFQQAKNGGQPDPSTAFKSFPPGIAVDVAA